MAEALIDGTGSGFLTKVDSDNRLYVDNYSSVHVDGATTSLKTIDYPHHEIHDGSHYYLKNFATLAADAELVFAVTTPNTTKWSHVLFNVNGTTETQINIFEGATISGGIAVTPVNNNRNSSNASTLTIVVDPVVSGAIPTSGTLISASSLGLAGATPSRSDQLGTIKREDELVLKSGTAYLFCILNNDAGNSNIVDYRATWYEHTDKIAKIS